MGADMVIMVAPLPDDDLGFFEGSPFNSSSVRRPLKLSL